MLEPIVPPLALRLLDGLHGALWSAGLQSMRLRPDDILRAARKLTGLDDLGERDDPEGVAQLHDGLTQVCASIEEDADITVGGRLFMRQRLVDSVATRLRLVDWEARHTPPPLRPPIVIIGLPRSGTTWLHRLMALGPEARTIALWEFGRPVAPRRLDYWITVFALAVLRRTSPSIDAKHRFEVTSPEEDMLLLDGSGVSLSFPVFAPCSGYLQWYLQQDQRVAYRYWARLLRVFQARSPGQRLVLKAPAHTPWVDALVEAVPEALLVQTHRDPVPVMGSFGSLLHTLRGQFSRRRDPEDIGAEGIDLLSRLVHRNLDVRAERPELRIVDVPYRSLVQSPLATVAHIHDALGLPFDGRARERVTTLVRNRPQRKYGAHPYSLGEIGLTEGQVRDRFARYDAFCAGLATIDSAPDIA